MRWRVKRVRTQPSEAAQGRGARGRALVSRVRRAAARKRGRKVVTPSKQARPSKGSKARGSATQTQRDKLNARGIVSDECYTPSDYAQAVRDVLGTIDLDPASCAAANEVIRARRFLTAAQNGLKRKWRGRVFLNCPYSHPLPWAERLCEFYESDAVPEAIALFNSRTGSRWFDLLASRAWRCEVRTRIKFWGPATSGGNGMQDQVFFYLGDRPERFIARFQSIGRIVPPESSLHSIKVRVCVVCRRALEGRRTDSETCSNACRQKRYRQQAQR